ncbi:unnamed protein product (macronuclear) [Paramecium tetraurelia]|uniref:MORN repeat protein n=1 Tax=Paramecium tetraurelia TaxID=5888 RepID=A0E2B5_PARTE|nr:uncharacterized protein GSPATT00022604001 [Paramecium tetraurelia]CAK89432.1 unnamed protein product [Paramecium tetraurelia]|eukprot:XP_001456829.1 hypothetical protein (macronuclear) [Paramecium tetraurelia strain d4-2]
MNQKCLSFGHNQRQIEFVCIQAKEILWGCSKCFEQNKVQYNFKPIVQIQKILNQAIQEIKNSNCLQEIQNKKSLFDQAIEQTNNIFIQNISLLKQSFELQYKELFDFLAFVNDFSPDNLDSVSNENSKYLLIVLDQKKALYDKFDVQATFTIERLEIIKKDIKKNINDVFDQGCQQILDGLNYKYNMPIEFRQQIQNLKIPLEYNVYEHPDLTYSINYKLDKEAYYSGQFCNNQIQGIGVLELQNQNIIYYGAFIEGHFTYGIKIKLAQNQLFQGHFYQGQNQFEYIIDSSGIMILANIERYDGSFKNELQEGYGITNKKNKDSYYGYWKNGKYEGQGCLISEEYGQYIIIKLSIELKAHSRMESSMGKQLLRMLKRRRIQRQSKGWRGHLRKFCEQNHILWIVQEWKEKWIRNTQSRIDGTFKDDKLCGKCTETTKVVVVVDLKQTVQETVEVGEFKDGIKVGVFTSITTCNNIKTQQAIK